MGLQVASPPTVEPVSLEEAKAHARVFVEDDDAYLGLLIRAARRHCEGRCNRSFAVQTYALTLDGFPAFDLSSYRRPGRIRPGPIELPRPPLVSVESIAYVDADGVDQVLDPARYRVSPGTPGRVQSAAGEGWPATQDGDDAVSIRYVAGWPAEELPEDAKLALLMLVGHWYDTRTPVAAGAVSDVPFTVDALLGGVDWRTRG